MKYLFTSESVTEGHPDKMCDIISDTILDNIISNDPMCRVACETTISTNKISVIGEISSSFKCDYKTLIIQTIKDIGYTNANSGFDVSLCEIDIAIKEQSLDISLGVNRSKECKEGSYKNEDIIGAGDQGIIFGYACDETDTLMPLSIHLAHKLSKRLTEARKNSEIDYLYPDGKTQVTVEYENDVPVRIDTIVISAQHRELHDNEDIVNDIINKVIKPVVPSDLIDDHTKIYINPTGRFVNGGPSADSGLTGRKIIVDTYGGHARHGGGAFSGKDPTKVDRSAAYMARYIAKNIVAAKLAKKCEIQIAYAIGVAHPVSIMVNTFNTGIYSDDDLTECVKNNFDLRPYAIIKLLNLNKNIYKQLSAYGHMGRDDIDIAWERTDKKDALMDYMLTKSHTYNASNK